MCTQTLLSSSRNIRTRWSLSTLRSIVDIGDDMGYTVFHPRTHTPEAWRNAAQKKADSPQFLSSYQERTKAVQSKLRKGMSIFDSRLLHCGMANMRKARVVLFHVVEATSLAFTRRLTELTASAVQTATPPREGHRQLRKREKGEVTRGEICVVSASILSFNCTELL